MHPGNHTAIFGSYFNEGKWGFACCHQFVRNSYCTGAAGRAAGESMLTGMLTMPPPKQPVDDDERGEREKEVKVSKCTLWGVRSVVMFCYVLFRKFWLPIWLHNSCIFSPSEKHHHCSYLLPKQAIATFKEKHDITNEGTLHIVDSYG